MSACPLPKRLVLAAKLALKNLALPQTLPQTLEPAVNLQFFHQVPYKVNIDKHMKSHNSHGELRI